MSLTTISSREFNQDVSKAKRAAKDGPVMITDRGQPAHVLLSIDEYQKLTENRKNILELLAMPEADAIDFDAELESIIQGRKAQLPRPAELF